MTEGRGLRLGMNKQEFSVFAAAIKTYYPRENLLPNTKAMELWFRQLEDIPYDLAELMLTSWVATNKWSPSIADIREKCLELRGGAIPDYGESWSQVQKAIGCYGMYREAEALESMDDLTRQVVKQMGFVNICTSDNPAAERANFRMIYEQLAGRKKNENVLPEKIRKTIEAISGSNQKLLEGVSE